MDVERKPVLYKLNVELIKRLKARAALEGVTMSAMLERVIGEYLEGVR